MSEQGNLRVAVIGGTGVEEALGAEEGERCFPHTPFGPPAAPITWTSWEGVEIAILRRHGKGHVHNPTHVPYRANMFALKKLGVTHVIATGATGSLREEVEPGHLVLPDQIIDRTVHRPRTFFEHAAVHVELADPFCPVMRRWLRRAAEKASTPLHDGGTYVCMEGPSFSTRAESHMHRQMGGDLIGMTVMPEARLAREAEMAYAMVAFPTDYDCWRPHDGTDEQGVLEQVIGNLRSGSSMSLSLIRTALSEPAPLTAERSPAHDALQLGIWSDKSRIDPAEVERLRPLWERYF